MTDIPDLARKFSRAAQEGRGIRLSAAELSLFWKVSGRIIHLAALPIEMPSPGPRAAASRMRRLLRRIEPAWVYFVGSGDHGPIKIGQARDPARRFASLQTSSPEPLAQLALTQDFDEIELHAFYQPERIRGEWFHPSPRLLAFIEHLAK